MAKCQHPDADSVSGFCDREATFFADVSADGGSVDTPVCADCAAFDMRRAGYATRPICAACAFLPVAERGDGSGWSCGVCGRETAHDDGVHTERYDGRFHEFVCAACGAAWRAGKGE